jgi:type IV secretory pathway TrbD component
MFDVPEGFEVPVYKGPLRERLSLGAPRDFTILMFGLFGVGFFWRLWAVLPLTGFLQLFAVGGTRLDPKWFPKISRAAFYKRYYKP